MKHPKFRVARGDVSNYIDVAGPVDYVLHFASPASPVDYLKLPIQTLKVGALGTHNALGLALAKNAKFFLASTSECYGDPEISPQHEEYWRSEEHTSELQSHSDLVCRLLLEKKKKKHEKNIQ